MGSKFNSPIVKIVTNYDFYVTPRPDLSLAVVYVMYLFFLSGVRGNRLIGDFQMYQRHQRNYTKLLVLSTGTLKSLITDCIYVIYVNYIRNRKRTS